VSRGGDHTLTWSGYLVRLGVAAGICKGHLAVTALLVGFLAAGVALTATAVVGALRGDHTITQDRVVTPPSCSCAWPSTWCPGC
jgi:hypothetical protein